MLSKKAATAIANVGKVQLRAFSLSTANSSDLAPIGADIRAGFKVNTPETLSQEVKDACFPQIGKYVTTLIAVTLPKTTTYWYVFQSFMNIDVIIKHHSC